MQQDITPVSFIVYYSPICQLNNTRW